MKVNSRNFVILIVLLAFLFGILFSTILRKVSASQFINEVVSPIASKFASRIALSQPHPPDVVDLERTTIFYPTGSAAGRAQDLKLLHQFSARNFREYRATQMTTFWQPDFSDVDAYLSSVAANRARLKGYLGELHPANRGQVISEQEMIISAKRCANKLKTSHVVIRSRAPELTFEAYILTPPLEKQNGLSVVAIHGHDSSTERLIGLEPEDYTRQMALRLACKGFIVIAPSVTSNMQVNNVISAYAHLYERRTLYGIMVEFIQSSLDVIEVRHPKNRVGLYGISNGALLSLLTSAIDERAEFIAAEGILGTFADTHLKSTTSVSDKVDYFYYFQGPFWMEFDIAELSYLSMPHVLVFSVGNFDPVTGGWQTSWQKISDAYKKLGLEQKVGLIRFHGQHELAEDYAIELLLQKLGVE